MLRTSNLLSRASWLLAVAVLIAACSTVQTPTSAPTLVASPQPTPTTTVAPSTPPTATPAPGSIVLDACGAPAAGAVCLGVDTGTIEVKAPKGSNLALSLVVTNPGGTATTPVSVLLYDLDARPLALGQPKCTTCNSTAGKSVIGLEWPALAPGETRTLSVDIPVTGAAGSAVFFADLYAQPLADVMAAQIANGIQPGQQSWKVGLAISSK